MEAEKEKKQNQEVGQKEQAQPEQETPKEEKKKATKKRKSKQDEIEELMQKLSDQNDKHLRLQAEFDNFRKRTLREKMEIMKSGGESVLVNILPVVDDFERAMQSMNAGDDNSKAVKEGIELIYGRFMEFLKQNNVKEIEAMHQEFNTDEHEAITKIPASEEKLKGKIVDVIQKGYYLNDKVIRFAKVVVGE